jgi:hypothetical protein
MHHHDFTEFGMLHVFDGQGTDDLCIASFCRFALWPAIANLY